MLRLQRVKSRRAEVVQFEGKLVEPWVEVARHACRETGFPSVPLILDLGGVTFVDSSGERLLCELLSQGAICERRSSFVAELLAGRELA